MQAVKQQYPGSSFDVSAPVLFRFKPPEGSQSNLQNPICIKFEPNPTGEWMLAKKNAGQVCIIIIPVTLVIWIRIAFIHCTHVVAAK